MDLLTQALHFAIDAHAGALRKMDGSPAAMHALEAAAIAATLTDDPEVMAAAALHDTIEDAGISPSEIAARFGSRVASLVDADTEPRAAGISPEQSWQQRKQSTIDRLRTSSSRDEAVIVLSDKLSNMRALYRGRLRLGDAMWQYFHQHDPARHHWYYRALAQALDVLSDTPAWREYDRLVSQVFDEQTPNDACH